MPLTKQRLESHRITNQPVGKGEGMSHFRCKKGKVGQSSPTISRRQAHGQRRLLFFLLLYFFAICHSAQFIPSMLRRIAYINVWDANNKTFCIMNRVDYLRLIRTHMQVIPWMYEVVPTAHQMFNSHSRKIYNRLSCSSLCQEKICTNLMKIMWG